MSTASETLSSRSTDNVAILVNRIVGFLAWIGVFIAGVLTYSHMVGKQVPCGASAGCLTVAQHPASKWFGVPVAYIGLAGYLALAVLSAIRPAFGKEKWRLLTNMSFFGTIFGFVVSIYFMYTSFAEIGAKCEWCIASAITMTISFILTFWLYTSPVPDVEAKPLDRIVPAFGLVAAGVAIGLVTTKMDKDMDTTGVKIGNHSLKDLLPEPARVRGAKDAPVTIIEFADFNCPACRAAEPTMMEVYQSAAGKIRWAFRNVPLIKLKGHETSMHVATLSQLAAEKGRFWEFFDEAFKETNTERLKSIDGVKQVAMDVGLRADEIEASLDPKSSAALAVVDDVTLSQELDIKDTPTFLILAEGVPPRAVTARRIKSVLAEPAFNKLLGGVISAQ
ncbi:MAG: vitamin K epoxide reductase family protein [Armatimonadetes bacterium]|nr:vitamin K epoxide reductase family protein [Armatimonadota bacterium]